MTVPGAILGGLLGSQAHGFATAESDHDYGMVFCAPIESLLSWDRTDKDDTIQLHDPVDCWGHELRKFVRLALGSNPTLLELLFLKDHTVMTEAGALLRDIRYEFLSASHVLNAYRGYAQQQLIRASSELRTEKGRRHALRLMAQGTELYTTGELTVRMSDEEIAEIRGIVALPDDEFHTEYQYRLDNMTGLANTRSALSDQPDRDLIRVNYNAIRKMQGGYPHE